MKKLLFSTMLAGCLATPGLAQVAYAPVELGAGYAFTHDNEISTNGHGFFGSVAGNVNDWFGIEGDFHSSFASMQVLSTDVDLSTFSFLGGPRFAARLYGASPFVHFLVGGVRGDIGVGGASVGSTTAFAIQPGGGVDIWMSDRMGLRLGADYQRWSDEGFSGDGFGFRAGVVFGLGEPRGE